MLLIGRIDAFKNVCNCWRVPCWALLCMRRLQVNWQTQLALRHLTCFIVVIFMQSILLWDGESPSPEFKILAHVSENFHFQYCMALRCLTSASFTSRSISFSFVILIFSFENQCWPRSDERPQPQHVRRLWLWWRAGGNSIEPRRSHHSATPSREEKFAGWGWGI